MRSLTESDKKRGVLLYDLGCIVCLEFKCIFTPCGIHHLDGKTKEGCHKLTIGLCGNHHQIPSNSKIWISRHGDGKAAFEKEYHSEQYLLDKTNELINA